MPSDHGKNPKFSQLDTEEILKFIYWSQRKFSLAICNKTYLNEEFCEDYNSEIAILKTSTSIPPEVPNQHTKRSVESCKHLKKKGQTMSV